MIAVFLCLMAAGISLTQALSDPAQVTLRWLRLGGLVAVAILGVSAAAAILTGQHLIGLSLGLLILGAAGVFAQLMAVQLGNRLLQRGLAAVAFLALVAGLTLELTSWVHAGQASAAEAAGPSVALGFELGTSLALSAGLLGGFLMTMLLGHAYLTAGGEMTQRPFQRLVTMLAALLLLRAVASVTLGLAPWWSGYRGSSLDRMWTMAMLMARYAVGLLVPAIFTVMTYDCVRRRANQSATGILYVAGVLVVIGEGVALALLGMVGRMF